MHQALVVISFVLWLLPTSLFAATYYVATTGNDANSCTQAQSLSTPKRTVQAGVNCATAAGDTVLVKAGTYVEYVATWRSGASGSPITVKANPGDTVVWTSPNSGCGSNGGAIGIFDRSYIRIEGFHFDNTTKGGVIRVVNSTGNKTTTPVQGIEIINNFFNNNGNNGIPTGCYSTIITLVGLGRDNNYTGTTVNTISGNILDGNYGFNIHIDATSDTLINQNTITNVRGSENDSNAFNFEAMAIFLGGNTINSTFWTATRNIVQDNRISNFKKDSYVTTAIDEIGIKTDVSAIGNIFQRNIIHDLDYTIPESEYDTSFIAGIFHEADCNNNINRENIIYRSGRYGIMDGGYFMPKAIGNEYTNNVIYDVKTVGLILANARNGLYRNNIIMNAGRAEVVVTDKSVTLGGNVFRNNDYYNASRSQIGRWNVLFNDLITANLALSQWNTSSGDTNSLLVNPLFITPPTDFHLQDDSPVSTAGEGGVAMGAYPSGSSGTPVAAPTNLRVIP